MVTPRSNSLPPKQRTLAGAWDRVKHAFERDWLQTRADFTAGGEELHQDLTDTVKQAVGAEPIPPRVESSGSKLDWFSAEPAVRYGYSAFESFGAKYPKWNDELDRRLERGWNEKATGQRYEDVRDEVKIGWHSRH